MLWRKFKLDWTYAIGELVIVTVGVLIALAVGQWNSNRLAVVEEAAYVSRLMSDIDKDIRNLESQINAVYKKQESLARIAEQLPGQQLPGQCVSPDRHCGGEESDRVDRLFSA